MAGDYNNTSGPQQMAMSPTFSVIESAVSNVCTKVSLKPGDSFNVVDYGSSHGKNSLTPMSLIIEAVRNYADQNQPIAIYHTDLPHNDYNTLFRTLHGADSSYLGYSSPDAPVFAYATATPFFQQILPSNSVHLGFSSCSAHWLSCFPGKIRHLYGVSASGPARSLWKKQAAVDWGHFLSARAKELIPGGSMILANLFMDEYGDFTTKPLSIIMDTVISEMQDINLIDANAAHRFSHPSYSRTQEEYTTPLPAYGLTLRDVFSRKVQNPIYQQYKTSGDWEGFGQAMVTWARNWCDVALLRVVEDAADGQRALDYFYKRVVEEIAKRPHDHQILMVMLYMVVEKDISIVCGDAKS